MTNFKSNNQRSGYAMRWIAHDGGNHQRTFIELNKTRNYDDYVITLKVLELTTKILFRIH